MRSPVDGHLKSGSVFHKVVRPELIAPTPVGGGTPIKGDTLAPAGAGFGDPAENRLVEAAAVRAVVKDYEGSGW